MLVLITCLALRLENNLLNIDDGFLDVQLFHVDIENDYYALIIQFLATGVALENLLTIQKNQLVVKASDFQLIAG